MMPIDPQPSWKLRRRAVFSSLVFGFILISYVTFFGESNSLNETIVLGAFGLVGAVVAAYIGGAAYEDVRLWKPQRSGNNELYPEYNEEVYDDTMYDNERNDDVH